MHLKTVNIFVVALFALWIGIANPGPAVSAAEDGQSAEKQKEQKFTEKMAAILFREAEDAFFYQREGRTDPFVPFVQERVVAGPWLIRPARPTPA